jgi:hypothetical protein
MELFVTLLLRPDGLVVKGTQVHIPTCLLVGHTDSVNVNVSRSGLQLKASLYFTERNGNGTKLKETNRIFGCWHALERELPNET